jgi:hypothetical protein
MHKTKKTARDGFEALAQYDANSDGQIDRNDAIFKDILVWQDANSDGMSDETELIPLSSTSLERIIVNPTRRFARGRNCFKDERTCIIAIGEWFAKKRTEPLLVVDIVFHVARQMSVLYAPGRETK